jgi:hypothetical protein
MNDEKRNDFDELAFNAITALNALMVNNTISKSSRAVVKINRFKGWLNDFWDAENRKNQNVNE